MMNSTLWIRIGSFACVTSLVALAACSSKSSSNTPQDAGSNLGDAGGGGGGGDAGGGGGGGGGGDGGGGVTSPCEAKTKCPNDKASDPSSIAECKKNLEDATCGAEYKTLLECLVQKAVCASDGTVDVTATGQACKSETDAYNTCANPGGDDAGGGDAETD